jgi:DNA-binding CsgD family transcriptional regulator
VGFDAAPGLCSEHWHHELAVEDVIRFRDLARAERPASTLRESVADPRSSPRFRTFLQPYGYADELRAVLRVADAPWASVTMWRREGEPWFSRREAALLADLSAPLAEALRQLARSPAVPAELVGADSPGLLYFDASGDLVSADAQASHWLAQLPPDKTLATDLDVHVPLWLVMLALRARLSVEEGDGTARTRVRSRRGTWLVCHASCTRSADGIPAGTVVVIERAHPAQIAPIIVASYGLTEREQQVTRLIARGVGTDAIANTLHLSPHTVKDHVKAVLAKVGVASRGELVATLYADLYEPVHLAAGH